MRQIRIVTLLLILPLLILLSACGKSPEKARIELGQMNIEYTKANFLKYAQEGDITVVDLFLKVGMDLNSQDERGLTASHVAAAEGHTSTVQLLLSKGADVNMSSKKVEGYNFAKNEDKTFKRMFNCAYRCENVTPLILAIVNNKNDVVKLLLDKGADINPKATFAFFIPFSEEPIFSSWLTSDIAILGGYSNIVKTMLDKGLDVNTKNEEGGRPLLHIAVANGHIEMVKMLISKGADLNVKEMDGTTALQLAKMLHEAKGRDTLIKLLKDAGAKE